MKIKKVHLTIIAVGLLIILIDFIFFLKTRFFLPIIVLAITVGWLQFWIDFFIREQKQKELEDKFPEFVRNLVNAIKSGMPAPTAIKHVADREYGSLTKHVKKLAAQMEWATPLHKALWNFALSTKNNVIMRAIATVIEAEKSGGKIEDVLDSVTESVVTIKEMKASRKANVHSQIIQSYIIFFVFLGVMITIMNSLVPYLALMQGQNLQQLSTGGISVVRGGLAQLTQKVILDYSSIGSYFSSLGQWMISLSGVFFMLAVIQGLFAGLILGRLAEGRIQAGLKHSLALMTLAALIMSYALGI